MKALVVIDMLNDFVTGKIANPRAEGIIPHIRDLVEKARSDRDEWLIAYANDAHLPEDFELKVWGEHSMKGTKGAEIIPELRAEKGDYVLDKRTYSCFFETALDTVLRAHDVREVVVTGLHTNICCRHTSADAFFRGYVPVVPEDGVDAMDEQAHTSGLEYLKTIYQADVTNSSKILRKWK